MIHSIIYRRDLMPTRFPCLPWTIADSPNSFQTFVFCVVLFINGFGHIHFAYAPLSFAPHWEILIRQLSLSPLDQKFVNTGNQYWVIDSFEIARNPTKLRSCGDTISRLIFSTIIIDSFDSFFWGFQSIKPWSEWIANVGIPSCVFRYKRGEKVDE